MLNDFEFEWKNEKHIVPANHVMKLIAKVEDVITVDELLKALSGKQVPFAKLAMAFGTVLRHVSIRVSDEEIYNALFENQINVPYIQQLLFGLVSLMLPPSFLAGKMEEGDTQVKK